MSRVDQRARFEAMYETHGPAVRTFVRRRVDVAVADDVVADVFLAAWRRLHEAPSDELPWLLGIARGMLANQRRGEARRLALRQRLAAHRASADGDEPQSLGADSEIFQALGLLSPGDQEILLLVAWDGLDRPAAAKVLGISPAVFAVRLYRARRRLEQALAGSEPQRQRTDSQSTSEVT
jgi:RNA polymerase sigma-70 factor, ECF subfamily